MRSISMVLATMLAAAAFVLPASAQEPATTATPPAMPAASAPEVVKTASSEMPATGTPSLTRADVEAWLDGFMPYALQRGDIAGAVVVVVKDGQILAVQGLWLCRRRARTAGRSGDHAVPSGLGVEALHLDGRDAAGRAGQDRSRRGRQHVPRFQDSGARRQGRHHAQLHDAYAAAWRSMRAR